VAKEHFFSLRIPFHVNVYCHFLSWEFFALDRFSPANKSDEKAYQEWQARLLRANRKRD